MAASSELDRPEESLARRTLLRVGALGAAVLALVAVLLTPTTSYAQPTASFSFSPPSPTTAEPVAFTFTGSCDAPPCRIQWRWYESGGSSLGTSMGEGDQIVYAFAAAGSYAVVVRITNSLPTHGSATDTQSILVADPPPPPPPVEPPPPPPPVELPPPPVELPPPPPLEPPPPPLLEPPPLPAPLPIWDVTGRARVRFYSRVFRIEFVAAELPSGYAPGRRLTWKVLLDGTLRKTVLQDVGDSKKWNTKQLSLHRPQHRLVIKRNGVKVYARTVIVG